MSEAFFTRAPSTIVTQEINGQTEFTIPFEFLARKFVVVTLLGVDRKVLTLNTDYRFIAVNKIRLEQPAPAGYQRIELRRVTSTTDRLVTFIDGSILRATDLNLAQVQTMHVAGEARDLTSDNIGVNDEGHLDARNRKIVNLANATDPLDAVNLRQLHQFDDSTANNADKAQASAAAAKISETNAKASENRSIVAEAKAVSSAGTAMTAASDANASKVAAKEAEAVVVPLVPIVEKASAEAAQAAIDAAQAVQDVKDLGAVPVGMIVMFGHSPIPAGFISLMEDNPTFNTAEYPDLAKLYPNGQLPSYKDRVPEGVGSGQNLVDATGTIFAIKAAGKVSDEGLMEVSVLKQDVENLKTLKADKANPVFTGDMNLGGSLRASGSLAAGQGSNSKVIASSLGESSANNWASKTEHQWYSGGVDVGSVRGLSTDCKGLYRTRSGSNALDYWQDPATGEHQFKNVQGQEAAVILNNGDIRTLWGGLLSAQLWGRAPKRWTWVPLGTMSVSDDAVLNLPNDVRGLRGFFGFFGDRGDIVYKNFTFPPLDCRFQINRKGDWQVFELANGGTTLIRRYGWSEGGDPYAFYVERPQNDV